MDTTLAGVIFPREAVLGLGWITGAEISDRLGDERLGEG
jgi:hypothetical protein